MSVPELKFTVAQASHSDAPVLVLGPSLGTSSLLWSRAQQRLQEKFTLVMFDLPGHGNSPKATSGFNFAELAQAVVSGVSEIAPSFFYAGVSLSGGIGQQLALEHPGQLKAAAIICSAAKFGSAEAWQERAAKVRVQGTSSLIAQSSERWFATETLQRDPDIVGRLLHTLADSDDESYALCCEALAEFDLRARLREIERPILAIAGAADPATPPATLEEIAGGVRHGKLLVIPEASHLAPAEQPELVSDALINFFLNER